MKEIGKILSVLFFMAMIAVVLTTISMNVSAQVIVTEEWVKRDNGPDNGEDCANAMVVDSSGNVHVAGYGYRGGTRDYRIIKYDTDGNLIWADYYNGPGNSYDIATDIAIDSSGNVHVTGYSVGSGGNADWYTIKRTPNGYAIWEARYDNGNWEQAWALTLDSSGNVYVAGNVKGSNYACYGIIKYDSSGNLQWIATYDPPENTGGGSPEDIVVDSSGNVYVTGDMWFGPWGSPDWSPDWVTIKYDSSGNQQWVKMHGELGEDDYAKRIAVDSSGNVYVSGGEGGGFEDDFCTIKYDQNGNQLKIATYNGPADEWDFIIDMVLDSSANVYVTGGSDGIGTSSDYCTIKYDSNLNEQWKVRYDGPASDYDNPFALTLDSSGNVYVTGYCEVSSPDYDYTTIAYDSSGNQLWIMTYDGPGNDQDRPYDIATDPSGNVYITGRSKGSGTDFDICTIKYSQNHPPTAEFTWLPTTPDEGEIVQFTDLSTDSDGTVVSWSWDFGGVGTSSDQNPQFTFMDDGVYTVTLTVTDDDGATDSVSHTVTILDLAPTAEFTWSPDPQYEGSPVSFTDLSTSYPDDIVSWSWDFGGLGSSSQQSPQFTFMDEGVYTVTLIVTDEDGSTDSVSHTVTILDLGPTAEFSWSPDPQYEGLPVSFNDLSSSYPDNIVSWSWDFAGLGSSSQQSPQFTFMDDGIYTVTLIVTDDDGSTDSISHDITIVDLGPAAEFSWSPEPQDEGSPVQFNDLSTSYPDVIVSWEWNFGDGGTSSLQNPSHTYGDNSVYTVTLTVTDDDGSTDAISHDITILNVIPTVDAGPDQTVNEGEIVTFSGSYSDPGWLDTHTIEWDFGDGGTASGTLTPSHAYGDNGVYTVTLTVTDDDGGIGVDTMTVTVNNVDPIVNAGPDQSVDEGETVTFSGSFTDPGWLDTHTIEWDFGDGGSDSGTLTPTYVYGDNGLYAVTLIVTDDDGGVGIDTLYVTVLNVIPTIESFGPFTINEGSPIAITATANDPGSDDLTFTWEFELGPTLINIYFNDGVGPDPWQSPWGTYPFSATDTVQHTYGDDGVYEISLTVEDDDGGLITYMTTITVNNVPATIDPFGPFTIDEGSPITLTAISTDPGSDDLTFIWEFELGPTITNVYYNDGIGPDPYPSPEGIYPFTVSDMIEHIYGDNGVYYVTLTVEDDDGGVSFYPTTITVNNVAPTVEVEAYMLVDFTLRVAGEKWHDVRMYIYADGVEIGYVAIIREPGDPDDQSKTIYDVKCDVTKTITVTVEYTPWDDPPNGQWTGADPCWVTFTFEDGSEITLHHNFNVNHPGTYIWNIDVNQYFVGKEITFKATATDPGSDDLIFTWEFEPGVIVENVYFNDGIGPDPFQSPWGTYPFQVIDIVEYTFPFASDYTVTLTVEDDDGNVTICVIQVKLS
ncbi:MAG: PKD domain-containing protein [Thermoplasmata archaeon]|nr:MAG: PKD domain-containing protein [Thermoplasmata archaeon]